MPTNTQIQGASKWTYRENGVANARLTRGKIASLLKDEIEGTKHSTTHGYYKTIVLLNMHP